MKMSLLEIEETNMVAIYISIYRRINMHDVVQDLRTKQVRLSPALRGNTKDCCTTLSNNQTQRQHLSCENKAFPNLQESKTLVWSLPKQQSGATEQERAFDLE
jgi:hypothetical protein